MPISTTPPRRPACFTTGVAHPGFWLPADASENRPTEMFTNRSNGSTLSAALDHAMQSNLVILEGFTDAAENAGYCRGANSDLSDLRNHPFPGGGDWNDKVSSFRIY